MASFNYGNLIKRLRKDGRKIARAWGLEYKRILPHDDDAEEYGCYERGGTIWVRLTGSKGKPFRYRTLLDTLCHELAHIRYFHHGAKFEELYWGLRIWAKARL